MLGSDFDPKLFLKPEAVADMYLHKQHPSAWTHELHVRPYTESLCLGQRITGAFVGCQLVL